MIKKVLIAFLTVIGILVLLGIIFVVGIIKKVNDDPDYMDKIREEENNQVIEFFMDQYENPDEIESVEVDNSYMLGSGSSVPFTKSEENIRVYRLIINDEYKADVWYNMDEGTCILKKSDFLGNQK